MRLKYIKNCCVYVFFPYQLTLYNARGSVIFFFFFNAFSQLLVVCSVLTIPFNIFNVYLFFSSFCHWESPFPPHIMVNNLLHFCFYQKCLRDTTGRSMRFVLDATRCDIPFDARDNASFLEKGEIKIKLFSVSFVFFAWWILF